MSVSLMKEKKNDESLDFLNRFVELYEDLLRHEGYADLTIEVRNRSAIEKEILLKCGKEYRYTVNVSSYRGKSNTARRHFKVVRPRVNSEIHQMKPGKSERRKAQRRKQRGPWNFRLERRINGDRRKS